MTAKEFEKKYKDLFNEAWSDWCTLSTPTEEKIIRETPLLNHIAKVHAVHTSDGNMSDFGKW